METAPEPSRHVGLRLQLLGPMALQRDGAALALPSSRKVRALVAYLALASHPVARSHLCELLWDLPSDPRGELRWSLSKARAMLDDADRSRVLADGETIRLELGDVLVDALEVQQAVQAGIETLGPQQLRTMAGLFGGEFLQGLEIERSAPYSAWLVGQRRRWRAAQVAILEHLVRAATEPAGDETIGHLERWLRLAPFDRRAHETLFDALARSGRLLEGDEHLAATARQFEAEGQDWAPLGLAWRAAKARHGSPMARLAPHFEAPQATATATAGPTRRASIAVMPFADRSRGVPVRGGLADGLAYDVITRLAKLRSLFVIAPGTVFALDQRHIGAEDASRRLDVDYVVSGSVRGEGQDASVTVQLAQARTARVVWADVLTGRRDEALGILEEIGNRIVSSLASQIEVAERNRAILKPPGSLDAWEAHHRGLWHMYRFDREDNEQARHFFEESVRMDPGFSRPYAGLSFTHFQKAFLGWGERGQEIERAYRFASEGLMADDRDPASHWALGRALWLRGQVEASLAELDTSVELSPNFALGHYTQAFVQAQSGDARAAIRSSDRSRELSPFDPLLFAMMATRAIALMRLGQHDEAADWVLKAIARPNAHVHIQGIAALCLAVAGRLDEARAVVASVRQRAPGYGVEQLFTAFRFADDAALATAMRHAAVRIGLG